MKNSMGAPSLCDGENEIVRAEIILNPFLGNGQLEGY